MKMISMCNQQVGIFGEQRDGPSVNNAIIDFFWVDSSQ
jgi:hypothetical protein